MVKSSDIYNAYLKNRHKRIDKFTIFLFSKKILAPIIRWIWIKKVTGIENIPSKGGAIIAFNHSSYFDFIAFLAICPRHVHFLTAEKFYTSSFWRPIMESACQIKVSRTEKDKREVFQKVNSYLRDGNLIGVFPEGTRAPSEYLMPAFGGVVTFATKMNVPVIPVGIKGAHGVMSRFSKFPRFKKEIEIVIDKPVTYNNENNIKFNKRSIQYFVDKLMKTIASLIGKTYSHKTFLRKHEYKKIAVFDIDGTLVDGQSQKYLLDYLFKKKVISKSYYYRVLTWFIFYRLGLARSPKKVMEYAYTFLKGKNEKEVDGMLELFVTEKLSKYFFKKGKEAVTNFKKKGREIFFISNMPEPLLKSIAKHYDVTFYCGTKLTVDKDGNFDGSIKGNIVYGVEKISALYSLLEKENFTLKGSWGYGDHISDIFLLGRLKNPVVVNPKKKLLNYAKKKQWKIEKFN